MSATIDFPYRHESLITGRQIPFAAMKVRHQVALVEMDEEVSSGRSKPSAFRDLFSNIVFELIGADRNSIYLTDFEALVFKVRAKSYGNIVRVTRTIAGSRTELEFDIDRDISVLGEARLSEVSVNISGNRSVVLRPLTFDEYERILENCTGARSVDIASLAVSIRKVMDSSGSATELTPTSAVELFNSLELTDLSLLRDAYTRFPRISARKEYKLIDGTRTVVDMGDLSSSFFVLS